MNNFCSSKKNLENEKKSHRLKKKKKHIASKDYACRICEDSYKLIIKINIKKKNWILHKRKNHIK